MAQKISITVDSLINNIANFEGKKEQEIDLFIEQFDNLTAAIELADELKLILLKSKITGNARQILINTPDLREEKKYEDLKAKLAEVFKTKKSFIEAQHKFNDLKQKQGQTIDDFVKEFNIAAQKYLHSAGHSAKKGAIELLQSIKLSKFLEQIRPDISFEVRKQGPETYEEATKIARKIEIALSNSSAELNNISKQHTDSTILDAVMQLARQQTTQIENLQLELNNLKLKESQTTPTPSTSQKNEPVTYCHICNRGNHSTQTCFYNKKNTNSSQNQKGNNTYNFNRKQNNFGARPKYSNPSANQRYNNIAGHSQPQITNQSNENFQGTYHNFQNFPQTFAQNPQQQMNQTIFPGWGYNAQTLRPQNTEIPNQTPFYMPQTFTAQRPMVTFPNENNTQNSLQHNNSNFNNSLN